MKPAPYRSLVQVHYHDRLSGVNKVIGLYAKAFGGITKARIGANLVVCSRSSGRRADFRPARVVPVPSCDYQWFPSKGRFEQEKELLIDSMEIVLNGHEIEPPVCVIGHNLTIGKNCALSAAFAEVARQHADNGDDMRFYSVIHDFAEEGRADCLKEIEKVNKWAAIEKDLFPSDQTIRFITLNAGNAAILEKAGFPATVLNNPVVRPVSGVEPNAGSLSLSKRASCFKHNLPIILYPSRCISRKNILEALLLCNFIYKSNLLIGASGTDAKDKIVFNKAVALCMRYRLPITFDYGRMLIGRSAKGVFTNKAFDIADACITTSVAEGFGYGLYEPWLYGKAVFGRKYPGFDPVAGVQFDGLYDRLPIPVKWISVAALRHRYWEIMNNCFRTIGRISLLSNRRTFDTAFTRYFVKNDSIDFGCLDNLTQFTILESLLKTPQKVNEWERACEGQLLSIKKSADAAIYKSEKIIRYNRNRIHKHLSIDGFSKEFKKVLSKNPPPIHKSNSREGILRQFCTFERFRLLLAK